MLKEFANAYRSGWGVPSNRREAEVWYKRAMETAAKARFETALADIIPLRRRTYVIDNGFSGQPCEIEIKAVRANSRLKILAVAIHSDQSTLGLSESPENKARGMPGIVALLVQPRGHAHAIPLIMVNRNWQLGGGLGPHAFRYGSETYRYEKKKDIWVRAGRHPPK